jgi:competence protein ComEC
VGGLRHAVAGFGYLLISGWGVATQRAYVMLAVMCLAVLLDRPAFTMRNLALAGIIVLLATPEAVLTASFQMSFMAVMGLIAFYEAVSAWRRETLRDLWPQTLAGRIAMSLGLSILAMAATTSWPACSRRCRRPITSTGWRPTACSPTCWRCRS